MFLKAVSFILISSTNKAGGVVSIGTIIHFISSVLFAVLEVNGSLSVLLKNQYKPLTAEDVKIEKDDGSLPLPVISDGKIISQSLEFLNLNQKKLAKILQKNKIKSKDVFLMMIDGNGNDTIIKKV